MKKLGFIVLLLLLIAGYQNCILSGTTVGNPLRSGPAYSINGFNLVFGGDFGNLSEIQICLGTIKFFDQENEFFHYINKPISFEKLSPMDFLLQLGYPPDRVTRIKLESTPGCEHQFSFKNSIGQFKTNDSTILVFDGIFLRQENQPKVELKLSTYLQALESVTDDSQITGALSSASGTF